MKNKLLLALTILIPFILVAQQEIFNYKGKVLEFQEPIEGVHIYNLSKSTGTSTNKNGRFNIMVSINDTLLISHVNYRNKRISISKEHLDKESPNIIFIEEMTNYLETVEIKNHNLLGILESDIKSIPNKSKRINKVTQDIIRLAHQSSYAIREYDTNIEQPFIPKPFVHDVNPIFMHGGTPLGGRDGAGIGKFKHLEIRKHLKNKRDFPKKIISDFGVDYFTNTLKIPSEKINHFLTYCEAKNIMNLYYQNEIVALITILHAESIEYLKIDD